SPVDIPAHPPADFQLPPSAYAFTCTAIITRLIADPSVPNTCPATSDCPHCQLFVSWNSEFPHDKNVEWKVQVVSHLISDWYAATRQCQYNYIRPVPK